MQKRNRIILIVSLIVLAFVALGIYAYLTAREATPSEPVTLREFFTLGRSTTVAPSAPAPNPSIAPAPTIVPPPAERAAIRQISTRAIAGAGIAMVERTIPPRILPAPAPDSPPTLQWSRNLTQGDTGQDVKELQVFLNQNVGPSGGASTVVATTGSGSPGNETTTFGPATKKAVINFQEKFAAEILTPQNLTAGTGIVDERTRAKIHELIVALPEKETVPALRYIDRETGNAYQTFLDTISEKRISSTTIPKIQEAFFGLDGKSVLLRFLADDNATITTFAGTLPVITEGGDSSLSLQGGFLEKNITALSLAPDGAKFFYLTNTEQSAIGTTATLAGTGKNQLWSSAYTEWLPQWVNARIIALTTKPSSISPGYVYFLDTQTRVFGKVLGDIRGLTTLVSPDGKKILYSRTSPDGNGIILALYDIDAKSSTDLGINTLPEKCAWSADNITLYCAVPEAFTAGEYPDIWYQGVVSFADNIWKLDTKGSLFQKIADPSTDADTPMDGTALFLDPRENTLFFTNKKDSTLWTLAL